MAEGGGRCGQFVQFTCRQIAGRTLPNFLQHRSAVKGSLQLAIRRIAESHGTGVRSQRTIGRILDALQNHLACVGRMGFEFVKTVNDPLDGWPRRGRRQDAGISHQSGIIQNIHGLAHNLILCHFSSPPYCSWYSCPRRAGRSIRFPNSGSGRYGPPPAWRDTGPESFPPLRLLLPSKHGS